MNVWPRPSLHLRLVLPSILVASPYSANFFSNALMLTKPWDVYACQLFPQGYGHPLWVPEPSSTSGREVLVGDVGWLQKGEFRSLFNSMEQEDGPANREKSVPRDFEVFSSSNMSIGTTNLVTVPMIFSPSINASDAQAEIATVA